VLYLSLRGGTPQAWLTDGSGDRQLTEDTLGITRAILSGDASVMLAGRQQEIHAERDRKLEEARKQRQIRRQPAA